MFIATPSGRKRLNVLGAVNAVSKKITVVTNTTYINSSSVCEILDKVSKSTQKPITIVLDNARYQKCSLVQEYAKSKNIELLFLPSYSPQLNLIERFWRLVKNECLNCKYYETFDEFKGAILHFVETANTIHQQKLESLMTLNFQSFENVQILTD